MLFGNGNISDVLSALVTAIGAVLPIDDAVFAVTEFADSFEVAEFVLAEAFVVAAAVLAVGLDVRFDHATACADSEAVTGADGGRLLSKTLANRCSLGPIARWHG